MATHLSGTRRRLVGIIALSALVGLICTALNTGGSAGLQVAAATTYVMVDSPPDSIVHRRALPQDVATLVKRAELLGRVLVTPPVLEHVGRRADIPPEAISGITRITGPVPRTFKEPGSERRASDIVTSRSPYRLEVQSRPAAPVIDIYAQAPTEAEAERLADAAVAGLGDYLKALSARQRLTGDEVVQLRQLGGARGGIVNARAPMVIAGLTFVVGFSLTCAALVGAMLLRRRRRDGAPARPSPEPEPAVPDEAPGGNWPKTTRVLPWMLAGFIAMLWLTPFNLIELNASLPIDLTTDRLLLPFIGGVWLLALAAGGKGAPRLRPTWIHAALGLFLACAFVSVVLDASALNRSHELDLALKKLPLLVSYITLFVIIASSVRRAEVQAYFTYTLVLAVVCGLEIIYEYRFKQNLFNIWSERLLPAIFDFNSDGAVDGGLDSLGRPVAVGPAEVGVEAVAMLSMALPIAIVGIMYTDRWRRRIVLGLAACVIVAATFATFRKTALVAPVSVILTLAYFRRRELLKLAPLGMVLVVVVSALSPGAVGSTVRQFTRSDAAAVPTTSDRTSDYDAIRPDLWSHFAFGRGWGTYSHESYRVLDSEILHRTVETGVLGLIAFVLIGISVPFSARRTIAARDLRWAPPALIGTAAGVCFLVVSTLFDVLSFPHATYIFLCSAGLVAAVIQPAPRRHRPSPPPRHAGRRRRVALVSRTSAIERSG